MDRAQVGRILHYVLDNGVGLHCRPALVVEDFPSSKKPGYVNLKVSLDGSNDDPRTDHPSGTIWKTAVAPNHSAKVKGTWHWPRECEKLGEPK